MHPRKFTKLICTISDKNFNIDLIKKLYDHGMDAVRLNTAHQSPVKTEKIIDAVRGVSDKIAIMLDTKGPELRTLGLKHNLVAGQYDIVKIGKKDNPSAGESSFHVNYCSFVEQVPVGTTIYIDEGYIELKVIEKNSEHLMCRVVRGGIIGNKRSVNVPSMNMTLPGLTSRDVEYIRLAINFDIDFIAHSFVRNKQDILNLQEILHREKSDIKIIAKIENRQGLDNFDEILQQAWGILIARGDLGVEIPAEDVPLVQKSIIRKCRRVNKPVLIATHLLESMIKNPRPTQAEISDVANAVLDGTDVLVLTGETAEGKYPVDSAETISKICLRMESMTKLDKNFEVNEQKSDRTHLLIKQASKAAVEFPVKAILSTSLNRQLIRLLSSCRGRIPVFVPAFSKRRVREFALNYGIYAQYIKKEKLEQIAMIMFKTMSEEWDLKETDLVVILSHAQNRQMNPDKMEMTSIAELTANGFSYPGE